EGAGRPTPGFPAAGVQPRGQHARLQVGRRAHQQCRGRAEGADRPDPRAGAEHRVGPVSRAYYETDFARAMADGLDNAAAAASIADALLDGKPAGKATGAER